MDANLTEQTASPAISLSHRHPLQILPLDVVLLIIDRLTPVEFIKFAFAMYPVLLRYNLVPVLDARDVVLFSIQVRRSRQRVAALPVDGSANGLSQRPRIPLPTELQIQIMQWLAPIDIMRLVVTNYYDLEAAGIAPVVTPATLRTLRMTLNTATANNN